MGRGEIIKDLERIIGVISYTQRCVKDAEVILGPLREGLKTFKSGQVSESWIAALNCKVKETVEKAIANVHWLILLEVDTNRFVFIIESD